LETAPEAIVEAVIERLRPTRPKLAALVSHQNGATLEGDCLRMGFVTAQQFVREQIEQEELRRILETEASEVAGRRLRIELGSYQPPEAPVPEESSPAKDELYERATRDPLVRSFVETFQGEVEEVRALGSDSAAKSERDRLAKR
jgi:hypothetical protein